MSLVWDMYRLKNYRIVVKKLPMDYIHQLVHWKSTMKIAKHVRYTYCRLSDVLNGLTTKSFDTIKPVGIKNGELNKGLRKELSE